MYISCNTNWIMYFSLKHLEPFAVQREKGRDLTQSLALTPSEQSVQAEQQFKYNFKTTMTVCRSENSHQIDVVNRSNLFIPISAS